MELEYMLIILCQTMVLFHASQCQQAYLNDTCSFDDENLANNISEGYRCRGSDSLTCESLVAYRPTPPLYATVSTIARLLGADSSATASLNAVSPDAKLDPDRPVLVPLSCACPVNYFQHFSSIKNSPTSIGYYDHGLFIRLVGYSSNYQAWF